MTMTYILHSKCKEMFVSQVPSGSCETFPTKQVTNKVAIDRHDSHLNLMALTQEGE